MDPTTARSCSTDGSLIEAARRGEPGAFQELLRRGDPWVRGVVRGVVDDPDRVDDVAQRVWLSVWQKLERLRDPSRWKAWLYRLARNAAADEGRGVTRRRRLRGELAEQSPRAATGGTPGSVLLEEERRRAVRAAIDALPEIYRIPLLLRHVEELSYREIAMSLGLPLDTVETRLVRARRKLRQALVGTLER